MALDDRKVIAGVVIALVLTALFPLLNSGRYLKIEPYNQSQKEEKRFEYGDLIPLYANKVFPRHKPCEEYPYYELPFCPPGDLHINRTKSIAELLLGKDCINSTGYELKFKVGTIRKLLCEKTLTKAEVAKFRDAFKREFEYQMSYRKFSLRAMVGSVEKSVVSKPRYYLVTHVRFYPRFLENKVKDINVVEDFGSAVDITEDVEVKVSFTYSVFWKAVKVNLNNSNTLPLNETSSQEDLSLTQENGSSVSWMFLPSIIVLWSVLLLLLLLPYFRSYFTRYYRGGIHGEACNCPSYSSLLGAIIGLGFQLLLVVCILFVLAHGSVLYPYCPVSLGTFMLLTYGFTSVVSGFLATAFHLMFTRLGWKECIFQTGTLYLIPACCTVFVVNIVARLKFGISHIPEMGIMVVSWSIATACLILGGKFAHSSMIGRRATCATIRIQSQILIKSWFTKIPIQMFLGGLIPFIFIFPEMDNIYASLWNLKICGAFQTMLISFTLIIAYTVIVAIGFTSYELFMEKDYQLFWRSVLRGGSTAIFMFLYGIYFFSKTDIGDQFLFLYLGYNACTFYALFLILGFISFNTSLVILYVTTEMSE